MTYSNDPNRQVPSYPMTRRPSYTGWVVGVLVLAALIVAVILYASPHTTTANNTANPPASTTGQAIPSTPRTSPAK